MDVYVAPGSKAFHISDECPSLAKHALEIAAVDVLALTRPKPCKVCLPDVPRHTRYHRPFCIVCNHARPCRHNGGVMVVEKRVAREDRGLIRAGDVSEVMRWVWPDSPVLLARHLAPVVE